MKLQELETAVRSHTGEFDCTQIHDDSETRVVAFAHVASSPVSRAVVPDIGRLRDFYDTFGSVHFYLDRATGECARHIAPPRDWTELRGDFDRWFDGIDEEELEEYAPDWVGTCLVIGETPRSGNYILVPTEGEDAGSVVEFDHDGMEFNVEARDVIEYVEKLLAPDPRRLTDFASHLRFIKRGSQAQWWIREMRDNRGQVVKTDA